VRRVGTVFGEAFVVGDTVFSIDNEKLAHGASGLEQAAARIRAAGSVLQGLPHPERAAGTGADELSAAFLSSWAERGRAGLMGLIAGLERPDGSTARLDLGVIGDQLAASVREASQAFAKADADAAETVARTLQVVLLNETGGCYLDHHAPVDGKRDAAVVRAERVVSGTVTNLKTKAFDLLTV
jgi:hypothetical protein